MSRTSRASPEPMTAQHADSVDQPVLPSLGQLLRTLGPHILQPVCAPHGYDVLVAEPMILGPGEDVTVHEDGVLLLVGGTPKHPRAASMVRAAAKARYSAVVVKARAEDLSELAQEAEAAGVALLTAPDDVPWRHLDALLVAATAATGPPVAPYGSVGIGDLFALANAIASTVGGAITIEDPQGRVLAYSNLPNQQIDEVRKLGILGRQTPERPQNREEYRLVCRAETPVRFSDLGGPDYMDRLAIAVRAGSQVLGLIWALDGTPPLGPGAESALETAARVTAAHLLRARNQRDPEKWTRSESLRSLLDGHTPGRIASAQLGIPSDAATVVLAVAPSRRELVPGLANARLVDLVSLYCESWHPNALSTVSGVVYALMPITGNARAEALLRRLADDIVSSARRAAEIDVHVAIGYTANRLDEAPTSRRSADRVLQALARRNLDGIHVATVEDLRSRVALLELSEEWSGAIEVMPGPVARILEHDSRTGTPYAHTVLAFLDAFGDVRQAAAVLNVHENTLRYRMRRVQETFALDLTNAEDRLVTWLQLRLQALQ